MPLRRLAWCPKFWVEGALATFNSISLQTCGNLPAVRWEGVSNRVVKSLGVDLIGFQSSWQEIPRSRYRIWLILCCMCCFSHVIIHYTSIIVRLCSFSIECQHSGDRTFACNAIALVPEVHPLFIQSEEIRCCSWKLRPWLEVVGCHEIVVDCPCPLSDDRIEVYSLIFVDLIPNSGCQVRISTNQTMRLWWNVRLWSCITRMT